jgi:DNA polymerase-3 subunit gamma/tau
MSELFPPDALPNAATPYRVLARKYRPQSFADLKGQDALVRTLTNAITSGRIAQAYMLTGVRGVGKTTTARLIARAINYTGPDGTSGPTTGETDDCAIAKAIAEDRCPDVVEMDAASHTGVDDMRDIIDGVRYAPTMSRYKVYIIDEVHMLSKQAFNALLKTLEEPPPHVKFIFATTEIRKVPITILSRCQRFDLRRFDDAELFDLLSTICQKENITADENALKLIARAGAGSARDGLSILDQAIALSNGAVTDAIVAEMLGLIDQNRVADLLNAALSAQIPAALDILRDLDRVGGDPLVILDDLLSLTHTLIKARVTDNTDDLLETARGILNTQTLPGLSRAWQILLKSYGDVQIAPRPLAAAEMAIIRLGYGATLPDPSKLIRDLSGGGAVAANAPTPSGPGATSGGATAVSYAPPIIASAPATAHALHTIEDVVAALEQDGQMILATSVAHYVSPVKIEPGRIDFVPLPGAHKNWRVIWARR